MDRKRKTASALSTFISENLTTIKNLAEYVSAWRGRAHSTRSRPAAARSSGRA